ncbi:MAG TPA: peptide chain release factor N(5)-glutamine methyltransferase [Candidatus Didemnitutus sp.]|nr:peptide chain release factor N(5)-glutamine methyltransferase [Candidatus Didemnitutus sp.]
MQTLLEIIKKTAAFFEKRGVESPRLNAELIIGHGLGLKRMQLYLQFERPLTEVELDRIRPLVKRRAEREPLQYVLGATEFAGVTLKVDRRALIPRPETEYLVELLRQRLDATPPARILDLGTGTGALALALAQAWTSTSVLGVDISGEALTLALENATALAMAERVRFENSDWFSAVPPNSAFELIVANPPYLSDEETAATQPEVRQFEPVNALSAGPDSAKDLVAIVKSAPAWLAPGGLLALETGIGHHGQLADVGRASGFNQVESLNDLTGRPRFVLLSSQDGARRPDAL